MSPSIDKQEQRKWKIPPNTRLNFELSQEWNSRTWCYNVVTAGFSALSSSLPIEKSEDAFAPSLHTLKSRLDAAIKQASALLEPISGCTGSKRKLEYPSEDSLPSHDAPNSATLKQRSFRTSTVRTSTQRRPETRIDEYVIEPSSSEESDELAFPHSKKCPKLSVPAVPTTRVSFGGNEVTQVTGAGRRNPHVCTSTCGEVEIPTGNKERSGTVQSSSEFVTSNLAGRFVHGKGARTAEVWTDSKSCHADETRQENFCDAPNSGAASSSVTSCAAKANDSRYGTLPVNLKRPEHVTSVETPNKRVRRNADQTIPVFGPTAGHGCAGPVFGTNELEGRSRSRVAPFCESSPRPPQASLFEESLVQDSQEDNELEDIPVVHRTPDLVVPSKGGYTYPELYDKLSVTAEGPYKLVGDHAIKSVCNGKRAQCEKQSQRGRLDAKCSRGTMLGREEGAAVGCTVQNLSRAESVTTLVANLRFGDLDKAESMSRGENGIRTPTNEKSNASTLSARGNDIGGEEQRHPGSTGNVNSKLVQVPDGSEKCPGANPHSSIFRTGRGNPVHISSTAMNRVMSLLDANPAHSEIKAVPKSVDLDDTVAVKDTMACLFQTGRGEPVHISSESIRKVQSTLVAPEPSPGAEAGRVRTSSKREGVSILKRKLPSNDQSLLLVSGREEFQNSGDKKENAASRVSHDTGASAAGVSLPRPSIFRTGRDALVSTSSATLERTRSTFEHDEFQIEAEVTRSESKGPSIFRTGRDAPVSISSAALQKTRSIFDDDEFQVEAEVSRLESKGPSIFRTGRDAPVSISSAALYKTRSIFNDDEFQVEAEVSRLESKRSSIFRTGRDAPVSISSEALQTTRSIFEEDEFQIEAEVSRLESKRSSIFRTGRDAPVSISSAALQKTRSIFEDDEFQIEAEVSRLESKRSSIFRTGNDTPVSISSVALQKIRSIFEDDEFQTEADAPRLESKRSPGGAELCERANYIPDPGERTFDPPQGLNSETLAVRDGYQVEAGRTTGTSVDEGIQKPTCHSKVHMKDLSPEARDWSFTFKGSSGRTLGVSSAAKAKAEALLKLGPEFVTPPRLEARRPPPEFCTKATESVVAPPLLDAEKRVHSASRVKDGRKQVKNDLGRKTPRIDNGGERGTIPGFKSPRLIRPPPSLCDRNSYVGLQSVRGPTARRSYLLPVSLHYLHNKISRNARSRLSMLAYFGRPPHPETKTLSHLPKELLSVTADTADTYRVPDGISRVGVGDIWIMLKDLGADQQYVTQGWVANHFRWIVWKLASYELKFPHRHARLLTLSSVLNELKYRYDRELNGERSALKRVTERDASAGQTMVLCVSAIRSVKDVDHLRELWTEKGNNSDGTKRKPPSAGVIEVTDGWYRLNAHIDAPLARHIHSGKLKPGQKIVVCGATLEGLSDGLPPLQAYHNAYLSINSNGVHKARWDQRLGFCGTATPLAFKCINQDGGVVPYTYVAITRRYPVLHREKLAGGGYILRSDRAEDWAAQLFDQRRAKVAEEIMQNVDHCHDSTDEGSRLLAALEAAADPEALMLDMTRAQLDAYAAFKARREIVAGDLIKTALETQGLATREVTPTFKVRVVGLNREGDTKSNKDGLVTIWQATEELQEQLQEGRVFCVYGLRPSTSGSYHSFNSTRWRPISMAALEKKFQFSYVPRAPLRISNLSEYMLSREFDVAGLVLFITDPVSRDVFRGRAKSQWVFMTDGSCAKGNAADAWEETQVLAIEVAWPEEAFVALESSLVGSVVGYCNLWLKHRDHSNRLWVAEASDRAQHSTKMTSPAFRHLNSAAREVKEWARLNSWNVDILQSDVVELAVHFKNTAAS